MKLWQHQTKQVLRQGAVLKIERHLRERERNNKHFLNKKEKRKFVTILGDFNPTFSVTD